MSQNKERSDRYDTEHHEGSEGREAGQKRVVAARVGHFVFIGHHEVQPIFLVGAVDIRQGLGVGFTKTLGHHERHRLFLFITWLLADQSLLLPPPDLVLILFGTNRQEVPQTHGDGVREEIRQAKEQHDGKRHLRCQVAGESGPGESGNDSKSGDDAVHSAIDHLLEIVRERRRPLFCLCRSTRFFL